MSPPLGCHLPSSPELFSHSAGLVAGIGNHPCWKPMGDVRRWTRVPHGQYQQRQKQMKQQLGQSSQQFMQEIGELASQIQQQAGADPQVQQAAQKIQQLTQQVLQNQQVQK